MKVCLKCGEKYGGVPECPKCGNPGYRVEGIEPDPVSRGGGPPSGGGGSNPYMGWIIFILIFVVGNGILYATTGIFLIPIPRR